MAVSGKSDSEDLLDLVNPGLDKLMDLLVGGEITIRDYFKGRQIILKARDRSMIELFGWAFGDRK